MEKLKMHIQDVVEGDFKNNKNATKAEKKTSCIYS